MLYTILFWILISRKEQKEKSIAKKLKTEKTQNRLLTEFKDRHDTIQFAKSELIEFINYRFGSRQHTLFAIIFMGSTGIDQETTENLANLIIDKAKNKGLIAEISNKKTLDDIYEWK